MGREMSKTDAVTAIIIQYSEMTSFREFELLMYEQACRYMEDKLRIEREKLNESIKTIEKNMPL